MRSKRLTRRGPAWLGGALLGSVVAALLAPGCLTRDVYFFDRDDVSLTPDAGATPDDSVPVIVRPDEPGTAADGDDNDDGDPPSAPAQPACETPACQRCVADAGCSGSPLPLCHPVSGECVAACDASSGDDPGNCPDGARCDVTRELCVECLARDDCAAPTPACDVPSGSCVACAGTDDCAAATPVCDTRVPECVECLGDGDCADTLEVCLEDERRCVECEVDADCARRAQLGAQDDDDEALRCSPLGRCVECLVDADCAVIEPDKPFCSSELECEDERE